MNKSRRNEIRSVINKLSGINFDGEISDIIETVSDLKDVIACILEDEEDYKDNIPENLQGGYIYEMSEESCYNLESAYDELDYIDENSTKISISDVVNKAIDYLGKSL